MLFARRLRNPAEPIFDQGLAFDLETILDRRSLLKLGLGAGLVAVAGCSSAGSDATGTTTASPAGGATGECAVIPEETAGPFPGDGSNGPDVLGESGIVRRDIRSSFGELSGTAEGVPLAIRLTVQDVANGCAALSEAAVYVWHCDRDGQYSLYTPADQNYLRGVQECDGDGVATFTSVFPACYSGRWPHVHFEVYPSLAAATSGASPVATSQIALPQGTCEAVYETGGYGQSVGKLQEVSLRTDNVFADDGGAHQLGTVTGGIDEGLVVELAVPVSTA